MSEKREGGSEPSTTTITLSEDGLKILRWLATKGTAATAAQTAFTCLEMKSLGAAGRKLIAIRFDALIRAGVVEDSGRGRYRITPAGRAFIAANYREPTR